MTTFKISYYEPHLGTPDDQGAVGGGVVVKQLEDEHPGVGDHDHPHGEHHGAHPQGAPPPVLTPREKIISKNIIIGVTNVPELRELVSEDGDHGLGGGELGPEAEGEQHHEEEDAPERRDRHPGHGLGVGDEGEASALGSHVGNL